MIKHYFKLIWKRKAKNIFLLLELAIATLIFFGVFTFAYEKYKVFSVPRGFDPENVYVLSVGWSADLSKVDSLTQEPLGEILMTELRSLPEVEHVSLSTNSVPYQGGSYSTGKENNMAFVFEVDTNYHKVWRTPLISGEYFGREDMAESRLKPVLINQKLVMDRRPEVVSPGKEIEISGESQVRGVLGHFKFEGDFVEEKPVVFYMNSRGYKAGTFSIRVKEGSGKGVKAQIFSIAQKVAKTDDFKVVDAELERKRANMPTVIPLLGLLFVVVFFVVSITVGLFGLLKFNINNRIPEVGVRKSMGASSGSIRKMFVGEMVVLCSLAYFLALFFALQVPIVGSIDVATDSYVFGLLTATILVFGVVVVSSVLSGQQVAKILPAQALREE